MTSKPVSALLVDLGVTRTHSRPRVSNDNPFSEAQFKTMKYLHDFPGSFAAIDDARQVTLNTAYAAHPERFAHRPVPPQIPTQSWINQPQPELQTT